MRCWHGDLQPCNEFITNFQSETVPCFPSDFVRFYQHFTCQVFSPEELRGHLASRWRFDNIRMLGDVPPLPRPRLQKEGKLPWVVTLDEGNCAYFNISQVDSYFQESNFQNTYIVRTHILIIYIIIYIYYKNIHPLFCLVNTLCKCTVFPSLCTSELKIDWNRWVLSSVIAIKIYSLPR